MTKVYVDTKYAFFKYLGIEPDGSVEDATVYFTECGRVPHIIHRVHYMKYRYIYCFSDAKYPPLIKTDLIRYIAPTERYKAYVPLFGTGLPPIPRKVQKRYRMFALIYDNYYFDLYAVSQITESKYARHIDLVSANNDRLTAYATHEFCLYTNTSMYSDDLYLIEAMANGCIPITYRGVPGIRFDVDGGRVLKHFMYSTYELVHIDIKEIDRAIETALKTGREEVQDMREKGLRYAEKYTESGLKEFVETLRGIKAYYRD